MSSPPEWRIFQQNKILQYFWFVIKKKFSSLLNSSFIVEKHLGITINLDLSGISLFFTIKVNRLFNNLI